MRFDSLVALLVIFLCLSPDLAGGQATPGDASASGSDPSTVRAQKKKGAKHPIAPPSDANCATISASTVTRGIDASGNPFVDTVDPDGTRRHRTKGRVTITSPNGSVST